MATKEYIKRIPNGFKAKLGLTRFKISLIKCNSKTQVKKAKMILELQVSNIFKNLESYDKETAKELLKTTLQIFLIEDAKVDFDGIKNKTTEEIEKVTIEAVILKAKAKIEEEQITKMRALEKNGIDISKKQTNATARQYNAILGYINKYFKDDFDIKKLDNEKAGEFRSFLIKFERKLKDGEIKNIDNNTINLYIRQLKTIFKNYIYDNNININNAFGNIKPLIVVKNKKMFNYQEILKAKIKLDDEDYLIFKTLLLSGMRYEELATMKKSNILMSCFCFDDAKGQFNKIVPIHKDILEQINKKLEKMESEEYLFALNETKRANLNLILKSNFDKTLHKTRATFVTYLANFKSGFDRDDINSLTHKVTGIESESYTVSRNRKDLEKIINSINLERLDEIEIIEVERKIHKS